MSGTYTSNDMIKLLLLGVVWVIDSFVGCLMTFFLKFHIKMINENKTTIENIDKKGEEF